MIEVVEHPRANPVLWRNRMGLRDFAKVLALIGLCSSMGLSLLSVMIGLIYRVCGGTCFGVSEIKVPYDPLLPTDLLVIACVSMLLGLGFSWIWERL